MQFTPPAIASIGWKIYIIFGVLNFAFLPIIYLFFPETKGERHNQESSLNSNSLQVLSLKKWISCSRKMMVLSMQLWKQRSANSILRPRVQTLQAIQFRSGLFRNVVPSQIFYSSISMLTRIFCTYNDIGSSKEFEITLSTSILLCLSFCW